MAAMLCYSESVDADTLPHPVSPPHTWQGPQFCIAVGSRCNASSCVTPPPPLHGQPLHPRNRTFKTMIILLIRVGTCSNNGYKSVKPIILHCHSFNREINVLSLANVGWDRKSNDVATCITMTLTLTVKLTHSLNLTLQLTLTLTHLDHNYSLTMHKSIHNNFPREAER